MNYSIKCTKCDSENLTVLWASGKITCNVCGNISYMRDTNPQKRKKPMSSAIDWKGRYQELAKQVYVLVEQIHKVESLRSNLAYHMEESDRLDLRERNKVRLMRLKEDVSLVIQYDHEKEWSDSETKNYPAGTLIECNKNGHVYLDQDGDGHLYFPPDLLEPVELDEFDKTIDWKKVIRNARK